MKVELKGWIVCADCFQKRNRFNHRQNFHIYTHDLQQVHNIHKRIDNCADKYPKTKDIIDRYRPVLRNTVVMKCLYNRDTERYDDIQKSHIRHARDQFAYYYAKMYDNTDEIIIYVKELFGDIDDEYYLNTLCDIASIFKGIR